MHSLAATLEEGNGEAFEGFLWSLADLIPCPECRSNLKKNMRKHPPGPYLSNNHDAFFYTFLLHDLVNNEAGKESPGFDDAKEAFFRALKECGGCRTS